MANTTKCTDALECKRVIEFKEFLQNYQLEIQGSSEGAINTGPELRTRNNTDVYNISEEELEAEIINILWQNLQTKNCPFPFKVGILRSLANDLSQSLKNSKETNDVIVKEGVTTDNENVGKQFHLLKLQKIVVENLQKLFIKLSDNSNIESLTSYVAQEYLSHEKGKCECVHFVQQKSEDDSVPLAKVAFIKNKPRKMEDRHAVLNDFGDIYNLENAGGEGNSYKFYGVFDGHSGSLAATYAATHLPFLLAKQLKERVIDNHNDEAYREAFETAFLQTDSRFAQKGLSSGTTAVCALLRLNENKSNSHLYVAWVGDSKAMLVSPKVSLQMVKPHKPDSPDEKKRIESSETGGTVLFIHGQWRVNGILNVARSIGDSSLGSAVIAEPDFIDICFPNQSNDFLILATDGLWDHVSETTIVDTVYEMLKDNTKTLDDIPKTLIDLAKKGDSQDNITVVLVFLKKRSEIIKS